MDIHKFIFKKYLISLFGPEETLTDYSCTLTNMNEVIRTMSKISGGIQIKEDM